MTPDEECTAPDRVVMMVFDVEKYGRIANAFMNLNPLVNSCSFGKLHTAQNSVFSIFQ